MGTKMVELFLEGEAWSFEMALSATQVSQRASKLLKWFCHAAARRATPIVLEASKLALFDAGSGEVLDLDAPIGEVRDSVLVAEWADAATLEALGGSRAADPWVLFCADERLVKFDKVAKEPSLAYLRFLRKARGCGCVLGADRLEILAAGRQRLEAEPPDDSEKSEFETLGRPAGVDRQAWTRLLTAREWKSEGDSWLATAAGPADANDALVAYARAGACVDDFLLDARGQWARRRLATFAVDLARALAVSTAVALLVSADPQACLDHLNRAAAAASSSSSAAANDKDARFCRAEALRRLGFPKLALDLLLDLREHQTLDNREREILETSVASLEAAVHKLANPVRRTKKRW